MERRLAAILVADVVGYSRLMGEDEMAGCGSSGNLECHIATSAITPIADVPHLSMVRNLG